MPKEKERGEGSYAGKQKCQARRGDCQQQSEAGLGGNPEERAAGAESCSSASEAKENCPTEGSRAGVSTRQGP